MNKDMFKEFYQFKPSDVIKGLNRYFAETKANRYRRVPLEIRKGACFDNPYNVLFCKPEEYVGVAINWLREEHDIFYTPGMEAPVEDFDVDESFKNYEKATRKDLKEALQKRLYDAQRRIAELEKSVAEKDSRIEALKADSYLSDRLVKEQREFITKVAELLETKDPYIESDISAIERAFTFSKKQYKSLQEFRDNVREILDIPSSMADDQEQILKEIHDFADRYYELKDFRADICEVLGIDADELFGSPQQNDQYILEQAEKMKDNMPTVFRNDVAVAIGMTPKDGNPDIIKRVMEIRESHDRLARLRSNICTALCLGHEDCDGNIIGRIHMMQDCHEKLCKDYTELRKAIWEAMDRRPETLPDETARLVGEVRMLQMNYQNMRRFERDYGAAQKILSDINEFRKWAIEELKQHGIVESDLEHPEHIDVTGSDIFRKLLKRYNWAYGEYMSQYRLRQQWYERYESEHKRANGEHKRAEKLRSDVTALKNHIELLRNANDSRANALVSLQAFKNECRKLKDEKTKVISALGQDIWDDCVK